MSATASERGGAGRRPKALAAPMTAPAQPGLGDRWREVAQPSTAGARCGARAAGVMVAALAGALGAPATAAEIFDDPFAYCAAVGTIDAPDARYVGPKAPDAVARGLKAALGLPDDTPLEPLRDHAIWRCMAGRVYACTLGANLPCEEKADTGRSPTSAMTAFCGDAPAADAIPMVVTGRATVYAWRCTDGAPTIERQITAPDARGYLADIWYQIARPESGGPDFRCLRLEVRASETIIILI